MTAPAGLDALWQNVLDRWSEQQAHAAFLEFCQRTSQLEIAAARYRETIRDGSRSVLAQEQLHNISSLALAGLHSLRTSKPQAKRQAGRLALAIVLLGFLLALVACFAFTAMH